MLSSEIWEILQNTFESTNNSIEHLRNRWRVLYCSKVDSLLLLFSKELPLKVKQVSNLNLLDTSDTLIYISCTKCLSPITGHHWCKKKKKFPLVRSVRVFKSWARLALFLKIYYFSTYIWDSKGEWKTLRLLCTKKRNKRMMLSCCNLKCFKVKYQLVKSTIQTLF